MSAISSVGGNSNWGQTSMTRGNRPPPPDGGDPAAMFKKIDSDGSGGVDATELQTMFTDMASKSGNSSNTPDASKMISEFDADGDGSLNQDELGQGMQSLMPPPNTMDFARQRSSSASGGGGCGGTESSQQTMDDLLSAIDTNQDGSIDKSELSTFKQVLTEQANSLTQTDNSSSSSSSSTSSDTSSSSSSSSESTSRQTSMEELARMVIQRYAAMAADTTQSSLSVAA